MVHFGLTNTTHLRIEYARDMTEHWSNHMHVAGLYDLRLPVSTLMCPFTFIDMIIRNSYPDEHEHLQEKQNYLYLRGATKKQINYFENVLEHDNLYLTLNK